MSEQRNMSDDSSNNSKPPAKEPPAKDAPANKAPGDKPPGEERNARRANTVDGHVGTRVRLRRMLLGMSQEKHGQRLGLTIQQDQKYQKGVKRIVASRLIDLAHHLGVPVQFFYDEIDHTNHNGHPPMAGFAERPAETYVVDFLGSRDGLELNKAFVRITDPKVRRSVIDLVRSLAPPEVA